MKISIDTREDSIEEIKKAIRMLYSLVQEREVHTNQRNIFEQSGSMQQPSTNVFGNSEQTPSSSEPAGNVFGNLFGDSSQQEMPEIKPVEKDEMPEIIPYD
ncbi:nucleoporin [Candidatus Woesearchaeota archaeon]|nr:nucleoporin [Candidatus Woesearchaeota archaeon]